MQIHLSKSPLRAGKTKLSSQLLSPPVFWRGLVITLMLALTIFAGCSKKATSPENPQFTDDQQALRSLVESDPLFDFSGARDEAETNTSGLAKSLAKVDTIFHWWRQLINRHRIIDIVILDSLPAIPTAQVTITDTLRGLLHVVGIDSTGGVHFTTPLTDVATRKALFKRLRPPDTPHRGWVLVAISGVLIKSSPLDSRQIQSVNLVTSQSGVNDTLVESDITTLTDRDSLITFTIGDTVWVTVTTGDASDSVYLHVRDGHRDMRPHRKSFRNNGDGTFIGRWIVPEDLEGASGHKLAVVDVIKHNVLDDHARYDSHAWGMVYRVRLGLSATAGNM